MQVFPTVPDKLYCFEIFKVMTVFWTFSTTSSYMTVCDNSRHGISGWCPHSVLPLWYVCKSSMGAAWGRGLAAAPPPSLTPFNRTPQHNNDWRRGLTVIVYPFKASVSKGERGVEFPLSTLYAFKKVLERNLLLQNCLFFLELILIPIMICCWCLCYFLFIMLRFAMSVISHEALCTDLGTLSSQLEPWPTRTLSISHLIDLVP